MTIHTVEIKCCKRPWGVFNRASDAMKEVESIIRCHEAYYKTKNPMSFLNGMKRKPHKTVVTVTCKPAVTWSDIYAGRV